MDLGGSRRVARADDGRGATSPLGVLLMVALSIVLVGAVGVFVFDIAANTSQPAPQASVATSFDDATDAVVLEHGGGDALRTDVGTLTVVATDESTGDVRRFEWSGGSDDRVRAEGEFRLDDATGADVGNATVPWTWSDGDSVLVRYERDGSTFVLARYQVTPPGPPGLSFSLDPRGNLSLWYQLDEAAGATGGSDIAYARGATGATGRYDDAYAFDGDDHAALRQSYATSGRFPSLSACAWFRTSEDGTGEFDNWALLDFDRSEYFNLYVRGDGRVGFSTTASDGSLHDLASPSGTGYADGTWHHACGVYEDDGTKRIYVDGTLVVTETGVHGGAPLGSGTTRYGFIGDGSEASSFDGSRNTKHYTGRVDEVRLYETALSASEVDDASDPDAAPTSDLALYYPLDDVVTGTPTFQVADAAPRNGQPTGTSYAFGGASGVHGTAFEFADSEYVALNASYADSGALPEVTACAWFRTTHGGGGLSENWALVDFDRSEYFNLYVHGDGRVGFSTSASGGTGGAVDDLYSSGTYNDGDWHLACGVYDDGEKRIYVDGLLAASRTGVHGGAALGSGTTRYGIIGDGSEAGSFDGDRNERYFDGRIDDIRVYDRPLDGSTTAGMYVRGVGASGDRVVTTEPLSFDAPVDPSTLEVVDVVASTPGSSAVEIRVQSDPDGDGDFEETSDPLTASGAPGGVTGLSSDSARYRLEVTLDADGADVPDFESARLVRSGSPSLATPLADRRADRELGADASRIAGAPGATNGARAADRTAFRRERRITVQ